MWRIPSLRRLRRVKITRHWRLFFYALALTALGGALVVLLRPDMAGVYLFSVYSIPSNSIVPVPHEPGLLYFAKYYDPFWIALAGCIGTGVAAFADYGVVEAAMRHPKINGAREARLFRASVKWLMRFPFLTCVVFAATPLPIYVVRILAPASGYPVGRYVAAIMLGRLPRFYLLAWIGWIFAIPTWVLVAMFVVLIGALVLASLNTSADGIDDDEEDEAAGVEILVPDLTDPEHPKPGISNTRIPRAS